MMNLFIKGLIIGIAIAAPVGPIGILCITRSLQQGFKVGFASGLGAATVDAIYGAIAGFSLTGITNFLQHYQSELQLIGGIFLCYLGIKITIAKPKESSTEKQIGKGLLNAYATTFFLTLTNPMTILSFLGIFAGLGLGSMHTSYQAASLLVGGVFIGSLLWWLLLSGGVSLFHRNVNKPIMLWINRISGLIIFVFGLIILANRLD